MRRLLSLGALVVSASLALVGCTADPGGGKTPFPTLGEDGCTPVVVATSSEKVNLMEDLGKAFRDSPEAKALGKCATIVPINVSSGAAADSLMASQSSWPLEDQSYWPTVWSPASTLWSDRVTVATGTDVAEGAKSFTHTPVVFGMPESMAKALGWPNKPIGIKDLEALVVNPDGWGSVGKPLWGSFKISKTNPNTSTTGLSAILMQAYAASGKDKDLTVADVQAAAGFSRAFESGAIHYGDTTGKVLTTLYNSTQGGGSSYVSAIALEETSLVNYNLGNPDSHTVQPGETLTPPKEKLVAIYPSEGSLWSDNPAVVLNAKWVTQEKREAGEAFLAFLQTKPAQTILPKYGFRPILDGVDASGSLNASLGVDLSQPTRTLPKPSPDVVSTAKDQWAEIRKPSAVLELIDISGSMDEAIGSGSNTTRLDGAIQGASSTLGNFRATDEVGVWAFTTGIKSDLGKGVVPVREFGPLGDGKESLSNSLGDLTKAKHNGTPLYDSVAIAYDYMVGKAEPGRINAIVVLSDGNDQDSAMDLNSLVVKLRTRAQAEGGDVAPVRIFTIAYSKDADRAALQKIAQATGGQMFDASDPARIQQVFSSVINNF